MGLCIGRKIGESVRIGEGPDAVRITVIDVNRGKAKLLIEAPKEVPIVRSELDQRRGDHAVQGV